MDKMGGAAQAAGRRVLYHGCNAAKQAVERWFRWAYANANGHAY